MKQTLIYLAFSFTFLFLGCKDDPIHPQPAEPYIPRITVVTENSALIVSKDDYLNATFTLYDSMGTYSSINAMPTTIKGRGNSTWNLPKKPYRLKFPNKTSLFGLTAAKDWVLLANFWDPTLLFNPVAFEAARRMGVNFANHSFYVELYLNGEYQGIYMVTEQVEINPGRVDIEEDDNCMLLEFDAYFDEVYRFRSDIVELPVMLKHPESDEGVDNARTLINQIELLLFADNYLDNWGKITELVDVNALINYLQVFELVANGELKNPKSCYAYRDKAPGSKLIFGPVWDCDLGYGLIDYAVAYMYFEDYSMLLYHKDAAELGSHERGSVFWSRFFHYPEFVKLYKDNWNKNLSNLNFDAFIDSYSYNLKAYVEKDRKLWEHWWWIGTPSHENYDESIVTLKEWLKQRINFLTTTINHKI